MGKNVEKQLDRKKTNVKVLRGKMFEHLIHTTIFREALSIEGKIEGKRGMGGSYSGHMDSSTRAKLYLTY